MSPETPGFMPNTVGEFLFKIISGTQDVESVLNGLSHDESKIALRQLIEASGSIPFADMTPKERVARLKIASFHSSFYDG